MRKMRLAVIGLVVSLLTVGSVYAQEQNAGKPDAGKAREGIYKELNLTPEQQQKLEANRKAQREKMSELRTGMMAKEKEMQQAVISSSRTSVEQLANEIKGLQAQLIDQRVNGIFAVKEILTPEQFAKLNQIMEKRKEQMKGRFQDLRQQHRGAAAGPENK